MTVEQSTIDAHRDTLKRLSGTDGPLREFGPTATVSNPQWFTRDPAGKPQPTGERLALHNEILEEFFALKPEALEERRCIVLAGPPGAGKSTTLDRLVPPESQAQWHRVDADHFKEVLLRRAQADGSYENFLVPPEVRELEASGERFFPLEMASLVHAESSMLAQAAREDLIDRGRNLIIDTVLSNPRNAVLMGAELEEAGYRVEVIDVECSFKESRDRIAGRWQGGYVAGLESTDPAHLGGRWVPSEYPGTLFVDGEDGSRPRQAAQALTERCGAVVGSRRYVAATAPGEEARLVSTSGRVRVGEALLSGDALRAARVAARGTAGNTVPSRASHPERGSSARER